MWGRGQAVPPTKGLLDVRDDGELERMAELQLQQLTIRLSYHDAIMFRHILHSLPRQAQLAFAATSSSESQQRGVTAQLSAGKEEDELSRQPANIQAQARQLASALGFRTADCLQVRGSRIYTIQVLPQLRFFANASVLRERHPKLQDPMVMV